MAYLSAGGPVDRLLTDIEMLGRLNGLELARLFHKAQPILPIVGTSGNVQPEAAEALGTFIPKRDRAEEHTPELQSLMRTSNDVFCLKKENTDTLENAQPSECKHG